ncbi:MAG: molybdopterin biosynthesis protein [Planctomycetaceae bacterium]|nr:molybdopterin biosynthesis protein [Planctomycetaceae bacterium]
MLSDRVKLAARQQQFLTVLSRDEAEQRFHDAIPFALPSSQLVTLHAAHGRVLAERIAAPIDVPGFDRSNVDGFAVRAADTTGAMEESPRTLAINNESLLPGVVPQIEVRSGTATPISTGGMVPRGADAVVMIEQTDIVECDGTLALEVGRAAAPGSMITFAGSDIALGETIYWPGQVLTSREIGVLAALGMTSVPVYSRPQVAIISTGDEVVQPGEPLPLGAIYDSNAAILAGAVTEAGGEPVLLGAVPDDADALRRIVDKALEHDVVLLSGGTSKGAGDLSYQIISGWTDPGIVAHGVALKPGKPICLAVTRGKPVVILPGFPTSAIFTFHEFVAPVIRQLAGLPPKQTSQVEAQVPLRIHSDKGRTEYLLVRLFETESGLAAYPLGKGSGAVTTFSQADGFVTIPAHTEIVDAEQAVAVTLLDRELRTPDLVVIGSHCLGLDELLGELRQHGFSVTVLHVGSQGGLTAAQRGECDLAGVHLLDPQSNEYNRPFVTPGLTLVPGYQRMQCFVCRSDDPRFTNVTEAHAALSIALSDTSCAMVNRNPGSGTRILLDQLLQQVDTKLQPPGYGVQVRSHNAVAAAIQQGRADWGLAIEPVAAAYGLRTFPVQAEQYDFVIPDQRLQRPAVQALLRLLKSDAMQRRLASLGLLQVGPGTKG